MNKTAIVTGGTSGIGKAAALALKNDGWTVYELSRRLTGTDGINHITADITDESGVAAALAKYCEITDEADVAMIKTFYDMFVRKAPFAEFVETLASMKDTH